ncbi:MAG: HAMP domain-containing histidine kinase [Burkholderiales bacterium]|nr:HAMP domain-containing histidine kinase [Burkholderiales bacterium]
MDASPPPLLSVLQFEGVVIAALAVMFAATWRRSREEGTPLLALGFALTALWYLNGDRIAYVGPNIDSDQQRVWSSLIGLAALLISLGVIRYLGVPRGRRRWWLAPFLLPSVLTLIAVALTPEVPRRLFHVGVLLPYAGAAALAFRRSVQYPGDRHLLLGIVLLVPPLTPYILLAAGLPPTQLKYFAGACVVLFGLALLVISLLRRQRALDAEVLRRAAAEEQLREANTRLEARVDERTVHLRELIQGLESFNRSVSHDLRGPLGGMSNLARLANEALARGDASMAQRALPAIATQCEASARFVGTMLELARLGDLPLRPQPLCPAELVQSAFDEVMLGAPPGPRPALHCAELPEVNTDPRLLRPVLVNLIGNAVKFSRRAAQPRIEIEGRSAGSDLTLCVRDNGVGLSAAQAQHIFEPFYRAHGELYEGHGLGLSIVRRAVQALGGRVWAEPPTQDAPGAVLCFTLPGAVPCGAPRLGGATPSTPSTPSHRASLPA